VTGQPALANSKEYRKPQVFENELEVVAAPSTSHSLVFLDQFTTYQINIVAFNPAGDGPPSAPITVTTLEGLPGPPANLSFVDITMNSLLVTWNPPLNRNGKIMGYLVSYETAENDESEFILNSTKSNFSDFVLTQRKSISKNLSKQLL
jgi:hypothetical protein